MGRLLCFADLLVNAPIEMSGKAPLWLLSMQRPQSYSFVEQVESAEVYERKSPIYISFN